MISPKMFSARLLGRLASGLQSDMGTLVHAVIAKRCKRPPCPFNDWGRKVIPNDDYTANISLCGKRPGRRSVGWDREETEVTCPRCLAKLAKSEGRS